VTGVWQIPIEVLVAAPSAESMRDAHLLSPPPAPTAPPKCHRKPILFFGAPPATSLQIAKAEIAVRARSRAAPNPLSYRIAR